LSGAAAKHGGAPISGPAVSWKGRRHGQRQDRRWSKAWSPEQIAKRLPIDFPDDDSMRISHEAIYQALFVQGRGALRRDLTACLRSGRALRVPRARVGQRGIGFVSPEIMISERPAEADDWAVPGHWEGDLILGLGSSAIGTLVERTTRFTMLLHLPRMAGHGVGPGIKNGPALAGHGAEAVRDAITRTITTLPVELGRSLTWDQGAEMAQHARLKIDAGVEVYFCDPQSLGNAAPTRTPTGCCANTFPRAPTSARIALIRLRQSPQRSMADRARRYIGKHRLRRLTNTLSKSTNSALRRPFESAQYVSIKYTERLAEAGIEPLVGSVGDSYDNALARRSTASTKPK
jgi:hypothetical protein